MLRKVLGILMKRSVILLAPFLLAVSASKASTAPVEFWYSHSSATARAISELCDRFNAGRSNDTPLLCVHQGSYEQILQKTVASYRAGESPALAEIYDAATADMMLGGATQIAESVMAEHNVGYAPETFVPALGSYYSNSEGLIAAQPFAASTAVMYSHRNALVRAGIHQLPQTWEDFAAALKALKKHGNGCPLVTDFTSWIWLEQTSATQGSALASQGNGAHGLTARYRFDQGSHPSLMNDLARWNKSNWVVDQAATRSGLQTAAFASGECAMLLDSTAAWRAIRDCGSTDIDITALPVYAGTLRHSSVPGGSALWVMRGHSRQDYAVVAAFLAFVLRPENQLFFSQQTGYLPVTQSAAAHVLDTTLEPTSVSVGLASLTDSNGQFSPPLRVGFMTRLRLIWSQQLQNAFSGRQTIEQALQATVQRGNSLLTLFEETYRDAPRR